MADVKFNLGDAALVQACLMLETMVVTNPKDVELPLMAMAQALPHANRDNPLILPVISCVQVIVDQHRLRQPLTRGSAMHARHALRPLLHAIARRRLGEMMGQLQERAVA